METVKLAEAAIPWDPAAYDAALARLYARYPDTRALLATTTIRTRGGS